MKTKAEIKKLQGKTVACNRIVKGATVEDIPEMRKQLLAEIENMVDIKMTETDSGFEFNNGQFFLKPRQAKNTTGTLTVKASLMLFNDIRIEFSDVKTTDKGFETKNAEYIINSVLGTCPMCGEDSEAGFLCDACTKRN